MTMKAKWLNRSLIVGPYLTLCTTEAQFRAALRHLKVKEKVSFLNTESAAATTHFLENPEGDRVCIVCIGPTDGWKGTSIAALLVHEAVHVWQELRDSIGERSPSSEFEAYSIQTISMVLMQEYVRQVH